MTEPPQSSSNPWIGQVLAQRYRVEAEIGKGGMGIVFRARHIHMQHVVALKVLHRELSGLEEVVKRFEREAIAGGRIRHPNVVTALDFGTLDDGSHYLVLDFVEGQSLSRVLAKGGVFSVLRALNVARQICSALVAAHAAGVVHRDLKPDNVMLIADGDTSASDTADFVKVLDFGIAKLASSEAGTVAHLTRFGSVFGTPEYMAPEQAAGKGTDVRSDLYALGIMLFEMLTGDTPFAGDDVLATLTRQITEPAPELPGHFPSEVRALVLRLLQKEADLRPASAALLLSELDGLFATANANTEAAPRPPGGTVHSLRTSAQYMSASLRALLLSRVQWRRYRIPVWGIGAGALFTGLVGMLTLRAAGDPAAPALVPPLPQAIMQIAGLNLERVRAGDREAIAEAERDPDEDGDAYWYALGRGYFTLKEPAKGLNAYTNAVRLQPALSSDEALLRDVWSVLKQPPTGAVPAEQTAALTFAGNALGAAGADMLYELSRSASASKSWNDQVRRTFDDSAKAHASEALNVLLDLSETKNCDRIKSLLPRVQTHADARADDVLRRRANPRGCGFMRMRDCYPCLRADDALQKAQKAAAARPRPPYQLDRPTVAP